MIAIPAWARLVLAAAGGWLVYQIAAHGTARPGLAHVAFGFGALLAAANLGVAVLGREPGMGTLLAVFAYGALAELAAIQLGPAVAWFGTGTFRVGAVLGAALLAPGVALAVTRARDRRGRLGVALAGLVAAPPLCLAALLGLEAALHAAPLPDPLEAAVPALEIALWAPILAADAVVARRRAGPRPPPEAAP